MMAPPFDRDDSTIYQWTLRADKRDWAGTLGYFLGATFGVPGALYLILRVVSLLSPTSAYYLGLILTGLLVLILIVHGCQSRVNKSGSGVGQLYYGAIITLGGLLYLLSSPVSPWNDGFHEGDAASPGQWLLFYVDNTASVILLDIPELFDLHLSRVRVESPFSRGLTLVIRLLITLGVVKLIYELIRSKHREMVIYATVEDFHRHCRELPDPEEMVFECTGKVEPATRSQEHRIAELLEARSEPEDRRNTFPQ